MAQTNIVPSSAPVGPAGADLAGSTFPNPTIAPGLRALITGSEQTSHKNQASGYAGLDGSSHLAFAQVNGALGAASSSIGLNGQEVTNAGTPTAVGSLATKAYVDSIAQGLALKGSVTALADANIAALTGLAATVDGTALNTDGMIVLLTAQTDPKQNGPWVIHAGAWTRPANFAAAAHAQGAFFFVTTGTNYQGDGFACTALSPTDVVGTDNLPFSQFSEGGRFSAGTGLNLSGNTLSAVYGTTAGTAAVGNDARFAGAEQLVRKGAANGYAPLDGSSLVPAANSLIQSVAGRTGAVVLTSTDVGLANVTNDAQVKRTEMGVASGVATLDANSRLIQGVTSRGGVRVSVTTTLALGLAKPTAISDATMTSFAATGSTVGSGANGAVAGSFASVAAETGAAAGQAGLGANNPLTDAAFAGQRISVQLAKANGDDSLLSDVLALAPSTDLLSPIYGYLSFRSDLGANLKWRLWLYYRRQSDGAEISVTPTIALTAVAMMVPAVYFEDQLPIASDFGAALVAGERAAELAPKSVTAATLADYVAAVPGNWASPSTMNPYAALDRLAALLVTLSGNPIP